VAREAALVFGLGPGMVKRVLRNRVARTGSPREKLVTELNRLPCSCPGISNAWTMPIKGRLDMLSTGIRTPLASRSAARTWA